MTKTVKRSLFALGALAALGAGAGVSGIASAQVADSGTTSPTTFARMGERMGHGPGREHGPKVMGEVTAVTGTTLTIKNPDGTIYTVDATDTTVSKVVTITAVDIAVGDTVGVQGTVTGTSVVAKHIMDGIPPHHAQAPPAAVTQ
ncbi:MAG: hypothetical protein AAB573_02935 [Patescibacteria group bacterium]